jgi:hypothetical protein
VRRVDFDIGEAAAKGARIDLRGASRVMEQHRELLEAPGVIGVWVGTAARKPCIMLAVHEDRSAGLSEAIPDTLDGINVYYVEGFFRR